MLNGEGKERKEYKEINLSWDFIIKVVIISLVVIIVPQIMIFILFYLVELGKLAGPIERVLHEVFKSINFTGFLSLIVLLKFIDIAVMFGILLNMRSQMSQELFKMLEERTKLLEERTKLLEEEIRKELEKKIEIRLSSIYEEISYRLLRYKQNHEDR